MVRSKHHTVHFHVDNTLTSYEDSKVNNKFHTWCNRKCSGLKPAEASRGEHHNFQRMCLDFRKEKGKVHVVQDDHLLDMMNSFPESINDSDNSPNLVSNDLFRVWGGRFLGRELREYFRSIVAKGIFISKRSCPDIATAISGLSSCVKNPNKEDWKKL